MNREKLMNQVEDIASRLIYQPQTKVLVVLLSDLRTVAIIAQDPQDVDGNIGICVNHHQFHVGLRDRSEVSGSWVNYSSLTFNKSKKQSS